MSPERLLSLGISAIVLPAIKRITVPIGLTQTLTYRGDSGSAVSRLRAKPKAQSMRSVFNKYSTTPIIPTNHLFLVAKLVETQPGKPREVVYFFTRVNTSSTGIRKVPNAYLKSIFIFSQSGSLAPRGVTRVGNNDWQRAYRF